LLFAPLRVLFFKNAEQEILMLFVASEQVDILINFTFDLLDLALKLLDCVFGNLSLSHSGISLLLPVLSGDVVTLYELQELCTIFLKLGARFFQSVTLTIFLKVQIFDFFFYCVI
jgi:hypothetical protein